MLYGNLYGESKITRIETDKDETPKEAVIRDLYGESKITRIETFISSCTAYRLYNLYGESKITRIETNEAENLINEGKIIYMENPR